MTLEWCSVYSWNFFCSKWFWFIFRLNFVIGPHVGGVTPKVAIPILMNDVDLKLSYVPIVTFEMSVDYVLPVSPRMLKERRVIDCYESVIIMIHSVKKTMNWNCWEIIELVKELHWITVKGGVKKLWHHVLLSTFHQILHLDFNHFIGLIVVFLAITMKHISTSICCIQGGGWCWPSSVKKNSKKNKVEVPPFNLY